MTDFEIELKMHQSIKDLRDKIAKEGDLMEHPYKYNQIEVPEEHRELFKEAFLDYVGGQRAEYMVAFYKYSVLNSIYEQVLADLS